VFEQKQFVTSSLAYIATTASTKK